MARNLFFIGFMGTGKSTVSAAYSKKYGRPVFEADDILTQRAGMSINEIFDTMGEEAFRNMETDLCREMTTLSDQLISCGGGMPMRPENVAYMKQNGLVVLLEATPETILDRVKGDNSRPILNGNMNVEYIAQLKGKRYPAYHDAADVIVWTDGKSVDEIVEEVHESVHRAGQSPV